MSKFSKTNKKCPSYANFSIIWFCKVWFGYISVWFGRVLHHLVCVIIALSRYVTMQNLELVASKMSELYQY